MDDVWLLRLDVDRMRLRPAKASVGAAANSIDEGLDRSDDDCDDDDDEDDDEDDDDEDGGIMERSRGCFSIGLRRSGRTGAAAVSGHTPCFMSST